HRADDGVAHLASRAVACLGVLENLRRRLAVAVAGVADVGMADVAAAGRLAVELGERQQAAPGPPPKRGVEVACQVRSAAAARRWRAAGRGGWRRRWEGGWLRWAASPAKKMRPLR